MPKSLSESEAVAIKGPGWANGCELCSYGLIDTDPVPPGSVVREYRLAQFRRGDIHFCKCPAGLTYQRLLADRDVEHAPNRPGAYSEPLPHERIPARILNYTFAGWVKFAGDDPDKAEAKSVIMANYNNKAEKPGVMLYGPSGTGKTGALTPLYKKHIETATGIWISYSKMLSILRDMDTSDRQRTMTRYQTVGHLFIDDFGDPSATGGATDYAKDCLFQIIDYRVNHNRPMYITTNLDLDQVSDVYHERIARRLDSVCVAVKVGGHRG